jgi:hypothetical protein
MAALVAFAAYHLRVAPVTNLGYEAPWRYWADGLEILHAGGIPASSPQWGFHLAPTVSKVLFNSFQAGAVVFVPDDPLAAIGALVWLTAAGLFAALLALGAALGLRGASVAVPVLVLAAPSWLPLGPEYTADLLVYRAENIGRMVAFSGLVAALAALRFGADRRYAVLAGLLFGAGALTHLIPVLVAGAFLLFLAAGRLALRPARIRPTAAVAGAIVAVAVAVWAAAILTAGGDVGFQRASAGGGYPGFPASIDPTKSFQTGHLGHPRGRRTGWAIPPAAVAKGAVAAPFTRTEVASSRDVLGLAAAAVVSLLLLWRRRAFGPLVGAAWLTGLAFVAAGLLFSHRYRTRIPADFGPRRLYENEVLLLVLVGVAAAAYVLRAAARGNRWIRTAGTAALGAGALALVVTAPLPTSSPQDPAGLRVMATVARTVPCGARILVDRRTAGSFEVLAGRVSVDEGMAPYLRPTVLQRVLPIVLEAHRFFRDPATNAGLLTDRHIDAVVVVHGAHVGGVRLLRHRRDGPLEDVAGLRLLVKTPSVSIYATPTLASAGRACGPTGAGP